MTSNWNISRVTGHLWEEFASHRWIPLTKASDAELWCFYLICTWTKLRWFETSTRSWWRQCNERIYIYIYIYNSWTNDALMLTHFIKIWIKIHLISCKKMALRTSSAVVGWVNKREAGDLKRYRAHYDVTVMMVVFFQVQCLHIIHC